MTTTPIDIVVCRVYTCSGVYIAYSEILYVYTEYYNIMRHVQGKIIIR